MTTLSKEVRSVMRNSIGALALVGLLGWAADAGAGWVIDQSVTGGNDVRQQVVVQANRMKTVVLEPDGKPGTAFIVDLNADTITQVDYAGKTYATTPVREYVQTVAAMQQSAVQQAAEMLKNVPPELRKSVEETMRRQMGATPGAQECVEPKIELRPTGQTTTIAGFPATRHDVVADGKPDVQVWVARTLTAWREIDPQKLQRFASEMAKLAACGSGARGLGGDAAWRMASEGYPVRTVDASGTTVEVQKAESRTVAAAEFQPPAGFARKSLAEMMGR